MKTRYCFHLIYASQPNSQPLRKFFISFLRIAIKFSRFGALLAVFYINAKAFNTLAEEKFQLIKRLCTTFLKNHRTELFALREQKTWEFVKNIMCRIIFMKYNYPGVIALDILRTLTAAWGAFFNAANERNERGMHCLIFPRVFTTWFTWQRNSILIITIRSAYSKAEMQATNDMKNIRQ